MAKTINKKKNWYKGLTATAISIAMAGAAFSVPALAIDYDLNVGDVTVDGNLSWQENNETWNSANKYDHSTGGGTGAADWEVNIYQSAENSGTKTEANQVDASDKESTTNSVTITDANTSIEVSIENVNFDNTSDETSEDEEVSSSTDPFLTINGEADVTITDSVINAEDIAIDINGSENGGTADVTIENSTVTGEDTAITVDNATANITLEGTAGDEDAAIDEVPTIVTGNTAIDINNSTFTLTGDEYSYIYGDVGLDIYDSTVMLDYAGTIDADDNNSKTTDSAIELSGKSTLLLKDDLELSDQITIAPTEENKTDTDVTLDLADKTLSSTSSFGVVINNDTKLTVNGSLTPDSSKYNYQVTDGSTMFYVFNGGDLTIANGYYHAKRIVSNFGKLTIEDGTFKGVSTRNTYMLHLSTNSESYIYGGTFTDAVYGIGIFNTAKATVQTSSDLSKYGNYTNYAYKLTEEEYNRPTKLVWGKLGEDGPSLRCEVGIYGNFWNSATDIVINSGEIIALDGTAIYHPQQGYFTMNGGYIEGATGIEAKMGHFTFNGGYVVGTGDGVENSDYTDILGGTTANGSAMKFELYYYGDADTDERLGARGPAHAQAAAGGSAHLPINNDFSLSISDGVFISNNNAPITIKNWNMCEQNVDYSITGGRYSGLLKTIEMKHTDEDRTTDYGIPVCDTVDTVYNYISHNGYYFSPAAYYDGVGLLYGFNGEPGALGKDAPYYASLAHAIADRDNDPDARAYIYYLLDNGLDQTGTIDRQTQIFYDKDITDHYLTESVLDARKDGHFGYSFNPIDVNFDNYAGAGHVGQYVLTNYVKGTNEEQGIALWSPAVFFNPNGGTFADGSTDIYGGVLASTASGDFVNGSYGNVAGGTINYMTYDELGNIIELPAGTVMELPENPTREGYTFGGWYYADGTPFDPSDPVLRNQMIYARWIDNTPYTPPYNPPEEIPEDPTPLTPTPEEGSEEIPDDPTPLTPSIPDEVIDDIIAEIEEEVTPLASVPKTGVEEENDFASAVAPAGVLAAAVAMLLRRKRRAE